MDQDSTNSGERRNWRERLGIAKDGPKDLPKISEEFVAQETGKSGEPRLIVANGGPQKSTGGDHGQAVPQIAPSGPRVQGAAPVRPAPMAPRPAANAAPPRAQGVPSQPQPFQRPTGAGALPPKTQPQPVRPGAPPQAGRPNPPQPSAAAAPLSPGSDDFAERLRQQREAAERLAKQRATTARTQPSAPPPLARGPEQTPSPPRFTFAPDELANESKPAQAQQPQPKAPVRPPAHGGGQAGWQQPYQGAPAQPAYPPQRGGAYPYGQQPYPQRPAAAASYPRPQQPAVQQPSPYAQEGWSGSEAAARAAPASRPAVQRGDAYAAQLDSGVGTAEDVYAEAPRPRRPAPTPVRAPALRTRVAEPDNQDHDDIYDDERPSGATSRQRAQVADYNNAYREYEEEYVEEEPRSRSGPLILLLALLALALIVGVLIFFYTQNFNLPASTADGSGDVPVIAAPEGPAKATPEPQLDPPEATAAATNTPPQQLQGRKQIYDRILGEDSVEQNKLVPTEEQPVPPAGSNEQGSEGTATGGGAPLPEPTTETAPPQGQAPDSADPEPLPLPPPPGTQGSAEPPSEVFQTASNSSEPQIDSPGSVDDTLIEPTSEQADADRSPQVTGKPAGSKPAAARASARPATATVESSTAISSESVGAVASSQPQAGTKPRAAKAQQSANIIPPAESEAIIDSPLPPARAATPPAPVPARNAASQIPPPPPPRPAASQSAAGPVQLGQPQATAPAGVGLQPGAVPPVSGQQAAFDQFQRQAQQSPTAAQRPRIGRNDDPLDGLRTPLSGRSGTTQQNQQLALAEPPPQAALQPTQPATTFAPQPAFVPPPQPAPSAVSPAPAKPAAQQQAALSPPATQSAPGGSGYVIQLASFRSEAEAAGEFRRLQSRHPQLVGTLQQRIQRADLGASGTFYRLGVGPLPSKDQASRLCNSLIAAGEKDCLVRRQ